MRQVAVGLLMVCLVPAQTSFDDLARRAEAAVDSKPAEAVDLFKQALAIRSDWAEGWLYLGGALYQLDRCAEATDAFRKGLALSPDQGTGWAFLGLCEAALDDPDQAIADILKGEQLGLGDNLDFETAVRVKAAQVLIRSSSFQQALGQLQPLSRRQVNSRVLEETMGLVTLAISTPLAELPAQRRAVVGLAGKAAWALGSQHPAEAAAAYQQLLEQFPKEPGVHYAVGLYRLETDPAAALAEFQKEIENNPKHWPSLISVGSLHTRNGAPELAIQALQQALKLVPPAQRWLCHAELGRANMTAGNLDTAASEFQLAARLMPTNAQVHFFLSQVYRRQGKKEEAQKETAVFEKLKAQQDPLGVPGFR